MPESSERDLIKQVFALPQGQALLQEWQRHYCRKIFTSDPQRLVRNAALADFITNIETVLNHD